MNVSLSIDEKPGALHVFAALDIIVLIMVLAFVGTYLTHRSGVEVTLPLSEARFAADHEALVLTMKGSVEPVYYIGSVRIEESDLLQEIQRKRDESGLQMVLIRADVRVPASWRDRLSRMILNEGLRCGWLAEPAVGAPRE